MTRVPKAKRLAAFEKKIDSLNDVIEKKENLNKVALLQHLVQLKKIERGYKDLVRDEVIDAECDEQYQEMFHHIRYEIYKQIDQFP